MVKARIAVLVSGGGTNLQALIDAQEKGILKNGEIVLVVSSSKAAFALERAKNHGIEGVSLDRDACPTNEAFEATLRALLTERQIELIVLAGFMRILSEDFTKSYPRRILNVHPALIPSFAGKGFYGLRVHQAALDYGVKLTGATVHFVNEIPDGGEILLQKAVPIRKGDTPERLQRRVMEEAEWKILPRACQMVSKEIQKGRGAHGRL